MVVRLRLRETSKPKKPEKPKFIFSNRGGVISDEDLAFIQAIPDVVIIDQHHGAMLVESPCSHEELIAALKPLRTWRVYVEQYYYPAKS